MSAPGSPSSSAFQDSPQMLGHPTGLYTLFFAEMWERFSYYGMRALLVFYMIKGFLGYGDKQAYAVYGAYTALVYATPFIGGMLADKLLGARKAVVLGGLLMAAGHLLMTLENETAFFGALALLIVGNGFFKPNISTIVGSLYPPGSPKRDGGFTIFYIGINLGAALAPLLCGYVGETFGWHYGFGLATIGMLIGLAVFIAPTILTQALILLGALAAAGSMVKFGLSDTFMLTVNAPVGVGLIVAAFIAAAAVGKGSLPRSAGRPPAGVKGRGGEFAVYAGVLLSIPLLAFLVQRNTIAGYALTAFGVLALGTLFVGALRSPKVERERLFVVLILCFFSMLFWAFFEQAGSSVNNFTDRNVDRSRTTSASRLVTAADVGTSVTFEPTQAQVGYRMAEAPHTITAPVEGRVERLLVEPGTVVQPQTPVMTVATVSEGKSEQRDWTLKDLDPAASGGPVQWLIGPGASIVTAIDDADDAKDRAATPIATVTGRRYFTLDQLDAMRDAARKASEKARQDGLPPVSAVPSVTWTIQADHVGMLIGGAEIKASVFQAVNPICIMVFGLAFTALWGFMGKRGLEPSTPVKFSLGLLQLGLGFIVFWYAAKNHDDRGMTTVLMLVLGYVLHTTGELCLSPVGLSMVTRLSPTRMVSTVMGAWFLATAFSNYLAGLIAALTGVSHGGDGSNMLPPPQETVGVYGDVFGKIGIAGCISAVLLLIISPLLSKWMHRDLEGKEEAAAGGH